MATRAELVAHLYRRAGFGARPDELTAATAAGFDATVTKLVGGLGAPDAGADAVPEPTLSPPLSLFRRRSLDAAARRALEAQLRQEYVALGAWWLGRMVATTNPLKEKLTLVLHGHFPTAISKVRYAAFMYGQNQIFRNQGAGDFAALTLDVAQDPAMLIWLDANSNKASDPNENFARELMERFTMGIGTYTQADVRAASYCFTGWRVDPATGRFDVATALHSTAPQTFLGTTGVTSGQQVVDIVTRTEVSSRFVPARLWSALAYPVGPRDPVVADLAPGYAADHNVGRLLAAIFRHPQFTQAKAVQGLVKQPIEYVAGTLRAFGVTPAQVREAAPELVGTFSGLGQVPFNPPSVGGWPQNGYWLSASAALARWQFAHAVARRVDISPVTDTARRDRLDTLAALLGVARWSPTTAAALRRAVADPPTLVTLALVSPEYVSN